MPVNPKEVLSKISSEVANTLEEWKQNVEAAQQKVLSETKKTPGLFGFGGASESKVKKLSLTDVAVNREYKNLEKLNKDLKTLSANLSDDRGEAISQIREVMMINYMDEYAQSRGENKKPSQLLHEIEKIILSSTADYADNFFMKNESLALKSGTGHTHFDSRFLALQYAYVDPELPKIVAHIFERVVATSAGAEGKNEQVYTNYMKQLVRVGLEVAASDWNNLVAYHLGRSRDNPFQITLADVRNSEKRFNENGIKESYASIGKIAANPSQKELWTRVQIFLSPMTGPKSESTTPRPSEMKSADDLVSAASPSPDRSSPSSPTSPAAVPTEAPPPLLSTIQPKGPGSR